MANSRYFRFAGQPRHYASSWHGLPPFPVRRGSRELGEANFYESSAPPFTRYRPLEKSWRTHVVESVAEHEREGLSGVAPGGPPLRPSGPEPLDPGEMPAWEPGYPPEPFAMPVGVDEAPGFMGLSRNETRLLAVGGVAAIGLFLWKRRKKK